jgi:hypothetical protein
MQFGRYYNSTIWWPLQHWLKLRLSTVNGCSPLVGYVCDTYWQYGMFILAYSWLLTPQQVSLSAGWRNRDWLSLIILKLYVNLSKAQINNSGFTYRQWVPYEVFKGVEQYHLPALSFTTVRTQYSAECGETSLETSFFWSQMGSNLVPSFLMRNPWSPIVLLSRKKAGTRCERVGCSPGSSRAESSCIMEHAGFRFEFALKMSGTRKKNFWDQKKIHTQTSLNSGRNCG